MLVLNLKTNHISPQYHVVVDPCFTSVDLPYSTLPENWEDNIKGDKWHANLNISNPDIDWGSFDAIPK